MSIIDKIRNSKALRGIPEDFVLGALETVSLEAINERQIRRFTWKIWEGEHVNGESEKEMRASGMIFAKHGSSYLIRDSNLGRYIYFQTFDPGRKGIVAMDYEKAKELAKGLCAQLAETSTLKILERHVEESFRSE